MNQRLKALEKYHNIHSQEQDIENTDSRQLSRSVVIDSVRDIHNKTSTQ